MKQTTRVAGIEDRDLSIQKWALTTKGEHSVTISNLIKDFLDNCNVPYECDCKDNDCRPVQAATNSQLENSIQALLVLVQDLDSRLIAAGL